MRKFFICLIFLIPTTLLVGQNIVSNRLPAESKRKALLDNSSVSALSFKSIGPSNFGGRIVDVDVNPQNPNEYFVSYATGGLWHTKNNGTTYEPLFQNESSMTIGDLHVNWSTGHLWLGSGENNSSRSSYAGTGIFHSTDWGKTWTNKGLPESHHIGRVVVDRENDKHIVVAVLGHLYTENPERGVYQTMDGGNTWEKVLFVNNSAGGIDLIQDIDNPNVYYAAIWDKMRKAWNFRESGKGSGIYKSTDSGKTWSLITTGGNGFPHDDGVGRIGLATGKNSQGETLIYAILDNYNRLPKKPSKEEGLTKNDLKKMSKPDFLALENDKLSAFLKKNRFPKKYTASRIKENVKNGVYGHAVLWEFLEDANSLLFDTDVKGAEIYVSKNQGKSWQKTHDKRLAQVHFTYGYYFAQIRCHPTKAEEVYIMGVPVMKSKDAGKSWSSIQKGYVHVDHHDLWINPTMDDHIILGNDGGLYVSYDDGASWIPRPAPPVGQFYFVAADNAESYNVYGGTQDNGVWQGPSTYVASKSWLTNGQYPYKGLIGGDGMQVQIDPTDNKTIYTGYQFGNYYKINRDKDIFKFITPKHELGERPYRWNWQSPILISPHQPNIIYFGSNHLHRSLDKADSWQKISGDLTKGGKKGDVPFGTITTISESPKKFGLIYVGSDDGMIHRTDDGGHTWQRLDQQLPQGYWVSRVWASPHKESRVYASLNGYRNDHFSAYVYVSNDYGKTWKNIGSSLPDEPVNVVKDDPFHENIVYVGTDNGLYMSLDGGMSFMVMDASLPRTPIHDLTFQEREKDIILGTHGRSLYKMSALPIYTMLEKKDSHDLYVKTFKLPRYSPNWGNSSAFSAQVNEANARMLIYSKTPGTLQLTVKDEDKKEVYRKTYDLKRGVQYITYNLESNVGDKTGDNGKKYLSKGSYKFEFKKDGKVVTKSVKL